METILDINDLKALNAEFCKAVKLKPVSCALLNLDTQELRTYVNKSCLYKKPKGWSNIRTIVFKNPVYPDFTEPYNFLLLLNIQWELFGRLDGGYHKVGNESFVANFLYNKIKSIQILQAYGGSDMLDAFISEVHNLEYEYEIGEPDD